MVKNRKDIADGFNNYFVKVGPKLAQGIQKVIPHIVNPPHMCNNSFKNGVFPGRMKIAKVIPHVFTNHRHISLLPLFKKILEKLYNTRLYVVFDFICKRCYNHKSISNQHSAVF